jgi:hypothetical protein
MDNAQKLNICTNVPSSQIFGSCSHQIVIQVSEMFQHKVKLKVREMATAMTVILPYMPL